MLGLPRARHRLGALVGDLVQGDLHVPAPVQEGLVVAVAAVDRPDSAVVVAELVERPHRLERPGQAVESAARLDDGECPRHQHARQAHCQPTAREHEEGVGRLDAGEHGGGDEEEVPHPLPHHPEDVLGIGEVAAPATGEPVVEVGRHVQPVREVEVHRAIGGVPVGQAVVGGAEGTESGHGVSRV